MRVMLASPDRSPLRQSSASELVVAPRRHPEFRVAVDHPRPRADNHRTPPRVLAARRFGAREALPTTVEAEWITTSTILGGLRDFADRAAWERFVERFRAPIVRLARGQGLALADAEDVAQETLLAFADGFRAGRYDVETGRLSRWLFGIAYRQILRVRDRRAPAAVQSDDSSIGLHAIADVAEATRSWDVEWERAILEQCLARARR